MKQELITEVMQQMLLYLDNAQLKQLKQVMEQTLFHYEVTGAKVKPEEDNSNDLIAMFIAAKRIEGCSEKTLKYYRTTIDAMVSSWNRAAPNTIPTAAKAGGNYLSSLLVGSEARRHGYQEGIALDVNGYISEGAGENLFEVKDGVLFTPPFTSSALPGITRDAIIKLAKELGIEVREQVLSRESLYLADEVFMSGTAAEITPVRSVDGIQVGEGRCGPVTKRIQQAFFGLFTGETEDKWGWLDQVNS